MSDATSNGSDFSIIDLDKIISDKKRLSASLQREVNENHVQAMRLREELAILGPKINNLRDDVKKLDATIIQKNYDLIEAQNNVIKSTQEAEMKMNEVRQKRQALDKESLEISQDRESFKKVEASIHSKLARTEVELMNALNDAKNREQQASGELAQLEKDKSKVREAELRIQSKESEVEAVRDKIKHELLQTTRVKEETEALKVFYESKMNDFKVKEKEFEAKSQTMRIERDDIDLNKNKNDEREHEIILEENRVRDAKYKLIKEVENAKIEASVKAKLIKEIQ